MNDEQFEYQMCMIEHAYNPTVVAALRARDTAQREALARVEAEKHTIECRFEVSEATLSCIRGCLRAAEGDIDQLKEQLAEALWHLDGVLNNLPEDMNNRFAGSRYFLARYAQAEQQEAQGALAVYETQEYILRAMGLNYSDRHSWDKLDTAAVIKAADEIARLRAALATQPAAGEPVAYISAAAAEAIRNGRNAAATLFVPPIPEAHNGVPVFLAPPAAVQAGDEAKSFERWWTSTPILRKNKMMLAQEAWMARAALATQPADSIAVNRLRLSLVAWDAELAEQDYQLTSDDLREKLRQIHRDIDRLMPEQGQAAVRGAEHE